jgi:hypothetical protein
MSVPGINVGDTVMERLRDITDFKQCRMARKTLRV